MKLASGKVNRSGKIDSPITIQIVVARCVSYSQIIVGRSRFLNDNVCSPSGNKKNVIIS